MTPSERPRETWGRQIEFLLVLVGQGVGFGNVWRFPYVCYKNGGGAFLIPYVIAVFLLGIPIAFMEGSLGQFTSRGAVSAFKIVPLLEGVGVMTVLTGIMIQCYYSLLFAWVLYYLFSSFTSELPWSSCNNEWNSVHCHIPGHRGNATETSNLTRPWTTLDGNTTVLNNMTSPDIFSSDPATEFWERRVLSLSPGVDHMGTVKWDLALCLLLVWILIYFCIWKGTTLIGKISYVTSTAPYVILVALLIRGATLEGAGNGIKFYIIPDWSKLASARVWLDACSQVFFSYGAGCAIHPVLGSCNQFRHNILKHYLWFALINSGTSFLGGFVIFSVLGYMANTRGVSIHDVAESGPGLAFIAYPQAISQMPLPQLWSILFFLMLCFVAIDSEFTNADVVIVSIRDLLPQRFSQWPGREMLTAAFCLAWYLIGLSMVTEGGVYIQQIFEWYGASKSTVIVVLLEVIVIAYFYGANRYQRNLEYMLGYRIGPFFKYTWLLIAPIICLILLVTDIVLYPEMTYKRRSGVYRYPEWTRGFGWSLVALCVVWVPAVAIFRLLRAQGTLRKRLRRLLRPEFTEPQQQRDRGTLNEDATMGPEVFAFKK